MGSAVKISFKGKKYNSFKELCNKFNLPESRVCNLFDKRKLKNQ